MDRFVNLHSHTTYSFLDGFGHPRQHVEKAKELNQSAIAVTDHGNISAHYKMYKVSKEAGIKAILGCEFYICDDIEKKERQRWHITIWAKNLEGYRNLIKLVNISWEQGFYYKPRIDWNLLRQFKKGLIGTSGCPSSKTSKMIESGMYNDDVIKTELKNQQSIFEDYYVELQPQRFEAGILIYKKMYQLSKELGIPQLMTVDAHYPNKQNAKIHDVLLCVQTLASYEDKQRLKFSSDDYYLHDRKTLEQYWNEIHPNLDPTEALNNTVILAEKIDFEFPKASPVKFTATKDIFNLGKKYENKIELLSALCDRGIKKRGFDKNSFTKEYQDRLKYELGLIEKKNFVDYFLVIADLVQFAKRNLIMVGPARGSAAGSLVCYLSEITEIDPLKYNLIFERFIDINREDLPDIDIDFQDDRRDEVKKYLEHRYGEKNVATLSTFGTFKGKMCVQDIGRVFSVPEADLKEVKKLMLERSGGDSRASLTVMDTFSQFDKAKKIVEKYPELNYAKELEGQIRHLSVHAAGVVVSNEPVENFAAFYKSNGKKILSMDYYDATDVGLLKIDLLGLNTLTVVSRILELIEQRHNKRIDLSKIDLEDKIVLKNFGEGKLFGIFQFDGPSLMQVCRQIKPDNFEELSAVNALSRPGPLHSHSTEHYIDRKFGKEKVTYAHPLMENLTKDTQGMVIYQEQVMKTMREVGKMSWKDTAEIRKLISKRQGVEKFDTFKKKFAAGAKENGLTDSEIDSIWDAINTFGSWAFNKSHSVSYSVLGFWCMFLKVYYPIEFYAAMGQVAFNEDRVKRVMKEFQSEGRDLLSVDVNKSKKTFSIEGENIRVGFVQVKGIGDKVAEKIERNQPYSSFADFKSKNGLKVSEILSNIGAMKDISYRGSSGQQTLFFLEKNSDEIEFEENRKPKIENLAKYCPMIINDKVFANWKNWCDDFLNGTVVQIKEVESVKGEKVMGILGRTNLDGFNFKNRVEEALSRGQNFQIEEGKQMSDYDFLNFDLEDETDFVTVRISERNYNLYKNWIWDVKPDDVLLAVCWVTEGRRMAFSRMIIKLNELKRKLENNLPLTNMEKRVVKEEFLV